MRKIRLAVFDLAGTIVEDGGAVLAAFSSVTNGFELDTSEDEINAFMGMSKREVFTTLAQRHYPQNPEMAQQRAEEALQVFNKLMRQRYEECAVPVPGAEETLAFLRDEGIKVAAGTGFDRSIAATILLKLAWPGRLVDTFVTSSDVTRGRPAPYMIFRAMEELDVDDVRDVMKVGDTPADLLEGAHAGCGENIGVLSGTGTHESLSCHPHTQIIASVAALPALFRQG